MHALLSIVLHHEKPKDYAEFEERLESLKWEKRIRMTWSARFNADVSYDGAVTTTKADIRAAMGKGKVKGLDAVLQIGNERAVSFSMKS